MRQQLERGLGKGVVVTRTEQRGHDRGVRALASLEVKPLGVALARDQQIDKFLGVGEIAVVAHRDGAVGSGS